MLLTLWCFDRLLLVVSASAGSVVGNHEQQECVVAAVTVVMLTFEWLFCAHVQVVKVAGVSLWALFREKKV